MDNPVCQYISVKNRVFRLLRVTQFVILQDAWGHHKPVIRIRADFGADIPQAIIQRKAGFLSWVLSVNPILN